MTMNYNEIRNNFIHHEVDGNDAVKLELIKDKAIEFAELITTLVPVSREQSLALTKLQEVAMWSNAGISKPKINEGE